MVFGEVVKVHWQGGCIGGKWWQVVGMADDDFPAPSFWWVVGLKESAEGAQRAQGVEALTSLPSSLPPYSLRRKTAQTSKRTLKLSDYSPIISQSQSNQSLISVGNRAADT